MTTTNATIKDAVDETADDARSKVGQVRDAVGSAVDQVPDALGSARSSAEAAAARLPDAAERARAGVEETTTRLQTLPDDTLRLMVGGVDRLRGRAVLRGRPARLHPRGRRARRLRRRSDRHPVVAPARLVAILTSLRWAR